MGEVTGIQERETLEAWLKGRSGEDAVCIAHRAAMRVAPLLWSRLDEDWALKGSVTAPMILWPLLASGVARRYLTPEVRDVARAARIPHDLATDSAAGTVYVVDGTLAAAFAAAYAADAFAIDARKTASGTAVAKASDKFWPSVSIDCAALEAGRDPFDLPLWVGAKPDEVAEAWVKTRAGWAEAEGPVWAFWTQFYENALAGHPQDWPLLHDPALIPKEDWQGGADRVHPIIEGMLKRRADQEKGKGEVAQDLANLPAAPRSTIQQVQTALSLNRVALPPTFDAIEEFIALEIARLQSRNHPSDEEAKEARRMIRTLSFLAEAVSQMRAAVPADGPAREDQATEVEGLARLYMKNLGELPRIKADEVVEGIWSAGKGACQIGLIGCSATLMVAVGLPALASFAAATLVFAPKLGSDAIKEAIELAKSQAKP
jgi:hypothetical protein